MPSARVLSVEYRIAVARRILNGKIGIVSPYNPASLLDESLEGIELLVPPDSSSQLPGAPLPANAPRSEEAVRMREVLSSEGGKARYAVRKCTVEPVYGQIKEARGNRRFRFRGLLKVTSEWKLICATHNLLKLFRHRTASPEPGLAELTLLLRSSIAAFRLPTRSKEMIACCMNGILGPLPPDANRFIFYGFSPTHSPSVPLSPQVLRQ